MAAKHREPKDWLLFESEVRQLVEAFGYEAEATQPSHDNGVDVIGFNQRRKVIVQCKLYGRGRIGNEVILKLIGSRALFGATDAICITTSLFTKDAHTVASQQNIHLIDRDNLILLCRERDVTIPSLTVLSSMGSRTFATTKPTVSFGREPTNDVIITDGYASRRHARLQREGLSLILHDCQSTNGTFVNGMRISAPIVLNYGDEFQIGTASFRISLRLKTGEIL